MFSEWQQSAASTPTPAGAGERAQILARLLDEIEHAEDAAPKEAPARPPAVSPVPRPYAFD